MAVHVLGWIFFAPVSVLFFVCALYGAFRPAAPDGSTDRDVEAAFVCWAVSGFASVALCWAEGWL